MAAGSMPLRAALKNRSGATAVELALVIGPFMWLLMGMGEFSLMSLAQTNLDSAVTTVAREIRTGAAQNSGTTGEQIKTKICDRLNDIMALDCDSLHVDVDTFESFGGVDNAAPVRDGSLNTDDMGYSPGGSDDVVLVRAYFEWEVMTPLFGEVLANIGDQKRLLASSMLFRNEPY